MLFKQLSRQNKPECAALVRLGLHFDFYPMKVGNRLNDRQPQPEAILLQRFSEFFKPVKDMRQLFRTNANAGIRNADDVLLVLNCARNIDLAALLVILYRIVDEVEELVKQQEF